MVSLSALASTLPHGFHDAQLQGVTIDYVAAEARLTLDIWIGDLSIEVEREMYQLAEVTLGGLVFWVIEAPDQNYEFDNPGELRIDLGEVSDSGPIPSINLPAVPPDAFMNWIYVDEWNCYIYVAARSASLVWRGDKKVRDQDAS